MDRTETGDRVRCRGLVKIYSAATGQVQALRGVDLDIPAGRVVAVVGPSGGGKSSLLRIMAGLERATAGSVTVDGIDLAQVGSRARRRLRARLLSHVYQRPADNLISHLTAAQQVARVAVRRGQRPDAAVAMLERVDLGTRLDHRPGELSGGEQQRLAFARAAVGAPSIIIADEPTAELDSANSTRVLDTIDLLVDTGVTVVVATHDPQVVERIDHVVILRDGAIEAIEEQGRTYAAIDHTGRIQLPPGLHHRFPGDRAVLAWNQEAGHLTVRPDDPDEQPRRDS
jgi:putative ABC transport system ATP-binding protein